MFVTISCFRGHAKLLGCVYRVDLLYYLPCWKEVLGKTKKETSKPTLEWRYFSNAYLDSAGLINFIDGDRLLSPKSLIAVMEPIHWAD